MPEIIVPNELLMLFRRHKSKIQSVAGYKLQNIQKLIEKYATDVVQMMQLTQAETSCYSCTTEYFI